MTALASGCSTVTMPVALDVSRDLVRDLWLRGFSHKDIQQQTGVKSVTLRAWIVRYGWKRDNYPVRPPEGERSTVAYQGAAERLAGLTITEADRIICHLRDSELTSIKDSKEAATALAAAYATARKALGLDDAQPALHLHYHGAGRPQPDAPAVAGPTIDVPSTPQQVVVTTSQVDSPSVTR